MITVRTPEQKFEIRPITNDDLDAVLEVYRHCEDFLALGPAVTASMEMVLKDIDLSTEEGGIFCGICTAEGTLIGVVDYVPSNYRGDPEAAFLELFMIDPSFRNQGFGKIIYEALEHEIRKNSSVRTFFSGVQVNNPRAITFWQRNGCRIISGPTLMPDQTVAFDLQKDLK